jgi:Family of unknown function (DUF5317)
VLIGIVVGALLASVPLAGGHLGLLSQTDFKGVPLLLVAIAVQIVIVSVIPGEGPYAAHAAAHLASYALVAVFLVLNRGFPYMWLIALGGGLNLIAIAANGGVMPADPHALAGAGIAATPHEFANSTAVDHARLAIFGDVFFLPESWPISNVFSIGDGLLAAGAFLALHTECASRLAVPRFARLAGPSRSTA